MLWQREDDHLTPLPVTNGDGGRELEFLRQMTLLSATGAGGIALAGINAGLDQTWPSVSGALQSLQLMDRVQLAYTGCPTVNALRLHANCLPSRMRLEWRKEMQKGCELPEIADDFLYAAGMREVRQRAVDRLQETDGRYRPEHVARVVNTALDIACTSQTPVCKSAVYLGALLHDVQKHLDMAHGVGVLHPQAGAVWAENALQKAGINDRKFILKVQNCIAAHSPEISSWVPPTAKSLEAKIVSDADRLDSLGAINILKGFYLLGFNIRSQKPIGRYGFSAVTTVQEALDAVMKDGETQVAQLQTDGGIWLGQHRLKDMQKIATSLKWELHYEA
jgi:HD superfamily phosphodiesterase